MGGQRSIGWIDVECGEGDCVCVLWGEGGLQQGVLVVLTCDM